MAFKTNTCKVATLEFDVLGEGMMILCIKDHVSSSELEQLLTPVVQWSV